MDSDIVQSIEQSLDWGGSQALSTVLAVLVITAAILWFAWISLSQLARLRSGEITVDLMLVEIARSFVVVLATFAIVYALQLI